MQIVNTGESDEKDGGREGVRRKGRKEVEPLPWIAMRLFWV